MLYAQDFVPDSERKTARNDDSVEAHASAPFTPLDRKHTPVVCIAGTCDRF